MQIAMCGNTALFPHAHDISGLNNRASDFERAVVTFKLRSEAHILCGRLSM
jgi:hypothetical protein